MTKVLLLIILLSLILVESYIRKYGSDVLYKLFGINFKDPLHTKSLCKYVSIRGIAGLCDKKPNRDIRSDHHNFDISDYADLRDYDTVFVAMFDLKRFLNEVFYVQNKKIILVMEVVTNLLPLRFVNYKTLIASNC